MRGRRAVVHGLAGGLLLAVPLARAQDRVYRVGFITLRGRFAAVDEAFAQAMRDLGYTVGRNLVIEYRFADNDIARVQAMARELAELRVDVIVGATTPAIRAAMRATERIPIVIAAAADPVGTGLVSSLRRPGGNVTGMTLQSTELAAKRVEILREIVPGATRFAFLTLNEPDREDDPARKVAALALSEVRAAAERHAAMVLTLSIGHPRELRAAFEHYRRGHAQALLVQVSPLAIDHRATIVALAQEHRLPALYEIRDFVDGGGLISYGPDLPDMYRRAAAYVDRILRGARPGELPIDQPGKFEFVVNLGTARALGLAIPHALLLRADHVIR